MNLRTDRGAYIASGLSAEGATGTAVDMRGTNGQFLLWLSGSGNGPTAGASANVVVQHSHNLTAWTTIALYTAVKGTVATAHINQGCFGYIRASAVEVYSAAQTGTGSVWMFVQPGVV